MASWADPVTGGVSTKTASEQSHWFPVALATLGVLELLWFTWFNLTPLPNAGNLQAVNAAGDVVSEPMRRWLLLALAVPQFIPGTTWSKSLLGHAFNTLIHTEFLYQRVPLIGSGVLIATAGLGLGLLILRGLQLGTWLTRLERITLGFGLGLNLLASLTLCAGRFGLLQPWPVRIVLGVLVITGLGVEFYQGGTKKRRQKTQLLGRAQTFLLLALSAPFLLLMLLGSFQPSVDFDAIEYHLQGPKEWFLAGKISFLPHNVYTSMPFSIEMLHLLGMEVLNDWWQGALVGQFLIMLHAPMAALALVLVGCRIGSPRVGMVAALVYLSTPWTYRLSIFGYVEGPLGYYHAALLLALERGWALCGSKRSIEASSSMANLLPSQVTAQKIWVVAGILAGGSMACKYPGLISAVVPAALVASAGGFTQRRISISLMFAMGVLLAIGPWLIKNTIDHGNPVYPLGDSIFHGYPWSPEREAQWNLAHGPRRIGLPEFTNAALEVAGRNDWQSPLYVALAPLAFCKRGSRRTSLLLGLFCLYIFGTWWLFTHRLDRFWIPILPPLALLAGLGADWTNRKGWKPLLWGVLCIGLFANYIFDISELAGLNQWTEDLDMMKKTIPTQANRGLAWLDGVLPEDARPLLVGPAAVFHMNHDHRYNTVFDDDRLERLARGQTPEAVRNALK